MSVIQMFSWIVLDQKFYHGTELRQLDAVMQRVGWFPHWKCNFPMIPPVSVSWTVGRSDGQS